MSHYLLTYTKSGKYLPENMLQACYKQCYKQCLFMLEQCLVFSCIVLSSLLSSFCLLFLLIALAEIEGWLSITPHPPPTR